MHIRIYYDGGCRVCAREMAHYRGLDLDGKFEFVDISPPEFKAQHHGRSREEFMARLHVKDSAGHFHTAVDAFAVIWENLPGKHYALLAWMIRLPGFHALANLGYRIFARLRPWLPKGHSCDDENCSWHHPD